MTGDIADFESYKAFENYELGLDTRLNFGAFGITGNAFFDKNNDNTVIDSSLYLNLRMDLSLLEFAFGAGYELPLEIGSDGVIINGEISSDVMEIIKNGKFNARVAAALNIGALTIGADYRIPVETLSEFFQNGDFENLEYFRNGKVSLSILCSVF